MISSSAASIHFIDTPHHQGTTKARYEASEVTVIEHPQTSYAKKFVFNGNPHVARVSQPKNLCLHYVEHFLKTLENAHPFTDLVKALPPRISFDLDLTPMTEDEVAEMAKKEAESAIYPLLRKQPSEPLWPLAPHS